MPTDEGGGVPSASDPRAARSKLHAHVVAVERQELAKAVRTLDAAGELTPERRRALEELTDELVAGLLASIDAALREAEPGDDRPRAVSRLFTEE